MRRRVAEGWWVLGRARGLGDWGLEKHVSEALVGLKGCKRLVGWLLAPSTGRLSRGRTIFEEGEDSSKKRRSSSNNPLLSSFFRAEDRRPHIFDLRAEDQRTLYLQSSIVDFRSRRSKNSHLRSSGPKNGSKIGRKKGVEPPIFHLLGTKNEELSPIFYLFGRKNRRRTPWYFFFRTLFSRAPAPLSYAEVWIFRLIFHLKDRSEDRDRPFIQRVEGLEEAKRSRTR